MGIFNYAIHHLFCIFALLLEVCEPFCYNRIYYSVIDCFCYWDCLHSDDRPETVPTAKRVYTPQDISGGHPQKVYRSLEDGARELKYDFPYRFLGNVPSLANSGVQNTGTCQGFTFMETQPEMVETQHQHTLFFLRSFLWILYPRAFLEGRFLVNTSLDSPNIFRYRQHRMRNRISANIRREGMFCDGGGN